MKGFIAVLTVIVSFMALLVADGAEIEYPYFDMLRSLEKSEVAFVGQTTAIDDETATVEVTEVLKGEIQLGSWKVSPCYYKNGGMRHYAFKVGEQTLCFGRKVGMDQVNLLDADQGAILPEKKLLAMEVFAAKRLAAIAALDEHEKNLAMIAAIRHENERLCWIAHGYISSTIGRVNQGDRYREELIALIEDEKPKLQSAGLAGLGFINAPAVLARIIALTHSENFLVVHNASLALGQYDTAETVAALIALTKHENYQLRTRAGVDLGNSLRPEAKAALVALLDDPDLRVRSVAPGRFITWMWRKEADHVLPKLATMLDDPEISVCCAAAAALGESRSPDVIAPLFAALNQNPLDRKLELSVFRALSAIHGKRDPAVCVLIDSNLEKIIATLMIGGPHDAWGPSFYAVNMLSRSSKAEAQAALRWASEFHPSKEIRALALRRLPM